MHDNLTSLLTPREIMALLAARLDPNDYTRLMFSSNIQVSSPQPDGSRILRLHTTLPAGVIIEPGVHLVDSRGASPNALAGHVPLAPIVRMVIRRDSLVPDFIQHQEAEEVPEEVELKRRAKNITELDTSDEADKAAAPPSEDEG
jgi:hypothetical protein